MTVNSKGEWPSWECVRLRIWRPPVGTPFLPIRDMSLFGSFGLFLIFCSTEIGHNLFILHYFADTTGKGRFCRSNVYSVFQVMHRADTKARELSLSLLLP
jgi:hypothetical protein